MEKISNNIYFLFVLTLFIYSFEENSNLNFCTIDNYKLRVHPCNHETQTRNISFYLSSPCTLPKNITKSNSIYYYYTLPTYNVLNCTQNEKIVFNPEIMI